MDRSLILPFRNHSIAPVEVSFQNINFRIPAETSNCHSSKGLTLGDTFESQSILVEQVDAGLFRRAWLRQIRLHRPFVFRKIPERGVQVGDVSASRGTIEVSTLVDIFTFVVWGKINYTKKLLTTICLISW